MRRSRDGIAHFWGILLALSLGCSERPSSETASNVHGSSKVPVLAVNASDGAKFSDAPRGTSQRLIASLPSTPAPPVASHAGPLRVAFDERTVMGQPLPKASAEHWRTQLCSLGDDQNSLIKVVVNPAEADWLVQVAALERTGILYVTPSQRGLEQIVDESLIMLPPGQPAMASLKAQLESIARAYNLVEFVEQDSKNRDGQIELEVELRRLADREDQIGKEFGPESELIQTEGTSVGFRVTNPNPFPVWVTLLFVDTRHHIYAIFPRVGGPTGRLEPSGRHGDACIAVRGTVNAAGKDLERLIVLGVKEQPQSKSAPDFRYLAQPAPPAARGAQSGLQQLMTAAVFGRSEIRSNNKDEAQQPVEEHVFRVVDWPAATKQHASRGALGFFREGSAEDLKAEIVNEQSGVYHTPNRTQAVLGTYGKLVNGNKFLGRLHRFEHRGLIQWIDRVRRFTTLQRRGRNAGQDFLSFVGNRLAWQVVDLAGKVSGGGHQEVEFELIGTRLDQSDVIRALNADTEALRYFNYLRENGEVPCVVLENIVMANYAASRGSHLNLQGNASMALTSEGVGGQLDRQRESSTQVLSPLIRCYQMYEVKQHQNQVVELLARSP